MKQNRRKFIATVAAVSAAVPLASALGRSIQNVQMVQKYPLRIFSKVLDDYDFGFMCECTSLAGIGGLDLTVRKGGKCEPADVEKNLPGFVDEAKKRGLEIDMIVTDIASAEDPFTERVLKTASSLGVRWYRLGWQEYDVKAGVLPSLDKGYKNLKGVARLNEKYRIHGGYQNHTGTKIGSPVWDIHRMISGLNPEYIGCQYDVRHATAEGSNSWIWGMRLLAPWIKTMAIKDMTWITGSGKPRPVTVPMGEGMVDWDLFFRTLKDYNIEGPMTIHIEYPLLDKGEETLSLLEKQDIIIAKLRKDVSFIKGYLNKYNLV
jgi:sugar phosphate isomerase/epimerase